MGHFASWGLDRTRLRVYCLIVVISKPKSRAPALELAKGQIRRLHHLYIQIVELGKRLLEYRMLDSLSQRGVRTQMSSVDVMQEYLRTRHAKLVEGAAEA